MESSQELEKIYTDISGGSGLASAPNLYKIAKQKGLKINLADVKAFLLAKPSYTKFKNARKRFQRNKTFASGVHQVTKCLAYCMYQIKY
jgi:hypothetical protein